MDELKFSARLNSFQSEFESYDAGKNEVGVLDLIERISIAKCISHIELNYPQHFEKNTVDEIGQHLLKLNLKLSGIGLRYDKRFYNGEFTNNEEGVRDTAGSITREAVDICRRMGGNIVTLWCANDGFDYAFQLDYEDAWAKHISVIREIAEQNPDIKISIEYKPYQPRAFSLIGDIGTTLLAIEDMKCSNIGVTLDFCHMLMKKENPAFSLALAASRGRLFGVHLNDGYKDNDDGLMIGSVHFMQTLEFIYYIKKYGYNGIVYFDTFPIREDPVKECEMNAKAFRLLSGKIDDIGLEKIDEIIRNRNALESQQMLLDIIGSNILT